MIVKAPFILTVTSYHFSYMERYLNKKQVSFNIINKGLGNLKPKIYRLVILKGAYDIIPLTALHRGLGTFHVSLEAHHFSVGINATPEQI